MDIDQILKKRMIDVIFQPIQDIEHHQVCGFEALARGPAGKLFSPANLFKASQKCGKLDQMELLCLQRALEETIHLPAGYPLFVNISPETLLYYHKDVIKLIESSSVKNVILELTEKNLKEKLLAEMAKVLHLLRETEIKIALDDVGSGSRGFPNICELPADFLKIDRCMIQGLTKYKNGSAPHYFSALEAMVTMAATLGAVVIAEGVETQQQFQLVKKAGVHLIQGYYIAHPKPSQYWADRESQHREEVTLCSWV